MAMNERQTGIVESERNPWVENFFRPLVVGVMVGCVVWSLIQSMLVLAPTWNPTYLLIGCVLAALEACYSQRLLQSPRMRGTNTLSFRLVELALIFLLLKAGRYIGRSAADVLAEIPNWPRDPSLLFDLETIMAFFLALLCWAAATQTIDDLNRIGEPHERHRDYVPPTERLIGRFFSGGVILLIAAGLAGTGDVSNLVNLRRPSVQGMVLNALIYFLLGVAMLGQARFLTLRERWQQQEMQVAGKIAGRWARYSLVFIGLAALLAFMLPTGFAPGLLSMVANSLGVLGAILYFIFSLIFALLLLPLNWLLWLFSRLLGEQQQPPPQPELPAYEPPQEPGPASGGTMAWLEILRALIFWGILSVVVFYVVRSYLRDRPELREAVTSARPLRALGRWWVIFWRWLRAWATRARQTVSEHLPRRLSRPLLPTAPSRSWRFFRLGVLSPRERVLYYYLSVLRRASQQGYPRKSHQTPQEYAATLEPNLPQARNELSALTEDFVEARYSLHDVEPKQEQQTRTKWERVKAALRLLKRQSDTDG